MFARINSLGVYALNGFSVSVEADISGGLPQFTIVGLPDSAVREATDRVRSALKNLSFVWPVSRITVNLAPGDIRKTGPVYDLPVLLAILAASGQLPVPGPEDAFIGELSLDGGVRSVTGVLPMALAAVQQGVRHLFVPAENAAEAAAAGALCVYPVHTALDAVHHLTGEAPIEPAQPAAFAPGGPRDVPDFADVRGQLEARRAMAQSLFDEVEGRIAAFTATAGYDAWLTGRAQRHAALAGQGVTVLLRPADESKQGLLRAVFPQASFETDRAIRCGGFKLVVGRVLYDETLDAAFAAEQERFTAESGLRV